jgi:hypothetical protein
MLFFMASSSDHVTGVTGLTPTVTLSKDGGSFVSAAGAVSEVANGWYALAGNATDRNTLGTLVLHATGAGADPFDGNWTIVPWDPFDGNLALTGLTGLNAVNSAGGLPTVGTGVGQISPDGTGSVPIAFGTALPAAPAANSVGEALFFADILGGRVGTAQAGAASSITLDAGASAVAGAYVGDQIYLYGGTGGGIRGTGQRRTVTAYNPSTKVATVNRTWDTTPDSTTLFMMLPAPLANVGIWNGTAAATTNVNGVPIVDLGYVNGTTASASNTVQIDMTQAVPTSNTVQTVGDALNAARAQGFGKWVISGTTLTLYAADGTTVVRTFTLDSASSPTQRA